MDCIARCVSVPSSPSRFLSSATLCIRVSQTLRSVHCDTTYLSLISKSVVSRHRLQPNTANRYIAVAVANGIMPLASANESSGYETRNKYFERLHRSQETSVCDASVMVRQRCCRVRGVHRLSVGSHTRHNQAHGCNHTQLGQQCWQAIKYLRDYNTINCYLDNDNAGKSAFAVISAESDNVIDCSTLYTQFNDLNEFLIQSANTINFNFSTNINF